MALFEKPILLFYSFALHFLTIDIFAIDQPTTSKSVAYNNIYTAREAVIISEVIVTRMPNKCTRVCQYLARDTYLRLWSRYRNKIVRIERFIDEIRRERILRDIVEDQENNWDLSRNWIDEIARRLLKVRIVEIRSIPIERRNPRLGLLPSIFYLRSSTMDHGSRIAAYKSMSTSTRQMHYTHRDAERLIIIRKCRAVLLITVI